MRCQLTHRPVFLRLRLIFILIVSLEVLLDEQTAAHLLVISVEPGALVETQIVPEIDTGVQRVQTCKLLVLDLGLVNE